MILRIYCFEHWFNLYGAAAEDGRYNLVLMCQFDGLDLGHGRTPDETLIYLFRHQLVEALFDYSDSKKISGITRGRHTIGEVSIVSVPPSTKGKEKR